MEYLLIIALQLIGCGLHVLQKALELDKKYPDDTLSDVFSMFWQSDKITLLISLLILCLSLIGYYVIEVYTPQLFNIEFFELYAFGIAFLLGYAGQRLIYKYLGKAEKYLDRKVDERSNG